MKNMGPFDPVKYLEIAKRRIYYILIPFLCTILGGLGYILSAPKTYEAQTLILVQPQRVPHDYVRSVISSAIDERLMTITQQVTSRTNLEKVIDEFKLLSERNDLNVQDKVLLLRKSIKIEVSGKGGAFTISYRGEDPKKVKQITDRLASNFISENLLIRESQALGTSSFLADELESANRRLLEKEQALKQYREKFKGGMPEYLESNLRVIERAQARLDQYNNRLKDLETRRIGIEKELEGLENQSLAGKQQRLNQPDQIRDLPSLREQLVSLTSKYTEFHPDVIKLKRLIEQLEAEKPSAPGSQSKDPLELAGMAARQQIEAIDSEIQTLKADIRKANEVIKSYQARVDNTPDREQELLSLNRDYANLKDLYDSLLKRKLEAELAVSMEKKQQGEQFRVIDPAKEPLTPITPHIPKTILVVIVIGLALGGGFAYAAEMLDNSFNCPDDLAKAFKIPILVSIPVRYTDQEYGSQKRVRAIKAVSVAFGFVISALGIVLAVKGVESTVSFVKAMMEKTL